MVRSTISLFLVALTLVGTAAVTGCKSGSGSGTLSQAPAEGPDKTRLATYAAHTQYPTDAEASDELKVTAVVDRGANTITLHNFGPEPIRDFDVWVNGAYVRHVDALPARGGLAIHTGQFFDARGASLGARQAPVTRVQIRANGKLYNAMGPAFD